VRVEDDQHTRRGVSHFVMWVARIDEGDATAQETNLDVGLVVAELMIPDAVGGRVQQQNRLITFSRLNGGLLHPRDDSGVGGFANVEGAQSISNLSGWVSGCQPRGHGSKSVPSGLRVNVYCWSRMARRAGGVPQRCERFLLVKHNAILCAASIRWIDTFRHAR
jgi:hypothetical protein